MSQQILELGRIGTEHLELSSTHRMFGMSKQQQFGVATVMIGTLFFKFLDNVLVYLFHRYDSSSLVKTLKKKEKAEYRFRNYFLSVIHSIISSIWALLSMYVDPRLREDMINPSSALSVSLVCFSIGYFIHDSYHILSNDHSRASIEIIPHHVIVVICFGTTIITERFVAYAVVALLVEPNSIFLHSRQLLIITQYPTRSKLFRANSIINLGTFILFRLSVLGWMTQWLLTHKDQVSIIPYITGTIGMFLILVINFVLFYRIVYSDFIKVRKPRDARFNNNDD